MKTTKKLTKDARIKAEQTKLSGIFANVEPDKRGITDGLISRAAFMKIEMEDLEEDLKKKGWAEEFKQGEQGPFMRTRPEGQTYLSLNKNYQTLIKQLVALLPSASDKDEATALLDFVNQKRA